MADEEAEVPQRLAVEVMRLLQSIKQFSTATERLMATLEMSMHLQDAMYRALK